MVVSFFHEADVRFVARQPSLHVAIPVVLDAIVWPSIQRTWDSGSLTVPYSPARIDDHFFAKKLHRPSLIMCRRWLCHHLQSSKSTYQSTSCFTSRQRNNTLCWSCAYSKVKRIAAFVWPTNQRGEKWTEKGQRTKVISLLTVYGTVFQRVQAILWRFLTSVWKQWQLRDIKSLFKTSAAWRQKTKTFQWKVCNNIRNRKIWRNLPELLTARANWRNHNIMIASQCRILATRIAQK